MREKIAKLENEVIELNEDRSKLKGRCSQLKFKISRIQDENHSSRLLHVTGLHTSRNMSVSSANKHLESSIIEFKPRTSLAPPMSVNSQRNKSVTTVENCLLMSKKDTSCKR
jgi:hypothetical protein